jgi:hypothetical protein
MSQGPVKRVFVVLETTAPPALFCSVSAMFMQLSLTQKSRKTQRLRERFLSSSAISYLRLTIVTESVTNCQTSGTLASDALFCNEIP